MAEWLSSLGHKRLLPKVALAEFALIEIRAHTLVDAGTFPFDNVGHRISRTPSTRHGRIGRESWAMFPGARRRLARPAVLPCRCPPVLCTQLPERSDLEKSACLAEGRVLRRSVTLPLPDPCPFHHAKSPCFTVFHGQRARRP